MMDPGRATYTPAQAAVPAEQIRALLRLLYPDEITPTAKRLFEQVIEQHELAQ